MEIVLVRHGATEWSVAHRHTGRTDIPLTEAGRADARRVGDRLAGREFDLVLTSPLARAAETCRLAGFEGERCDDLVEWDYGDYDGITTKEIRTRRPDWDLWRDGCPGGESPADVGARADRVLERLKKSQVTRSPGSSAESQVTRSPGSFLLFAHGHLLRVLAARWLGQPAADGRLYALHTGAVSTLGFERETHVIWSWNRT